MALRAASTCESRLGVVKGLRDGRARRSPTKLTRLFANGWGVGDLQGGVVIHQK